MFAKALGLLGLPALLVGGWAVAKAPAPASGDGRCSGAAACVETAPATPALVAGMECPPCPACPLPVCPPCEWCP